MSSVRSSRQVAKLGIDGEIGRGITGRFVQLTPGGGVVEVEHFGGPCWLVDFAAGAHLCEPGFDVDDWRAVDGVQVFDVEVEAVDFEKPAAGDAEPVEPAH